MQKIYYLSTCDTCKRVMSEIEIPSNFVQQDIKFQAITEKELAEMAKFSGNYESLFSRRAKLFQERKLKDKKLTEQDFKNLILEHYTFLKRPVIINKNKIFIGSSPKTVAEAKKYIHSL